MLPVKATLNKLYIRIWLAVVLALLSASANTGVVVVVVPLVHTHLDLVHRYLPLDHVMFGLHEPPVWVVALVDR